ncbi:MAG: rod shape-determining protein MreC [Planctomycetes bacterium]|nr:rod shape-determining protein MreC [Planctomycetota bacterium]
MFRGIVIYLFKNRLVLYVIVSFTIMFAAPRALVEYARLTLVAPLSFISFEGDDEKQKRIELLESELARVTRDRDLAFETIGLREQTPDSFFGLPATVLASKLDAKILPVRGGTDWSKHLLLNQGAIDDVNIGNPVVHGSVLVGEIVAVGMNVSRVRLLSETATRVAVSIGTSRIPNVLNSHSETERIASLDHADSTSRKHPEKSSFISAILTGSEINSSHGELIYVPEYEFDRLQVDLPIYTSGKEGLFPAGLLVGVIWAIEKDPAEQFLTIEVKLAIDGLALSTVEILNLNYNEDHDD